MKIIITVFLKEMLEFLRDSRSVIITLLLPLLLFPAVFTILGHRSERSYVIYLRDNDDLGKQLSQNGKLVVRDAENEEAMVLLQKGDLLIEGNAPQLIITVNNREKSSIEAGALIEKMLQGGTVTTRFLFEEAEARSYLFLSILLPVIFSVIAVNAPSTAAGHLMGGEKERSTLEALFGTLTSRSLIMTGKFIAVWVIGLLSATAYLGGLLLAYSLNTDISPGALSLLTFTRGFQLFVLFLSLIFLTGAIELLFSTFASSSREAILCILPLTVLFLALSYFAQELGDIPAAARYVPVVNFSLAVRDVIAGTIDIATMARIVVLNFLSALPFLGWALMYARDEKVIYR